MWHVICIHVFHSCISCDIAVCNMHTNCCNILCGKLSVRAMHMLFCTSCDMSHALDICTIHSCLSIKLTWMRIPKNGHNKSNTFFIMQPQICPYIIYTNKQISILAVQLLLELCSSEFHESWLQDHILYDLCRTKCWDFAPYWQMQFSTCLWQNQSLSIHTSNITYQLICFCILNLKYISYSGHQEFIKQCNYGD